MAAPAAVAGLPPPLMPVYRGEATYRLLRASLPPESFPDGVLTIVCAYCDRYLILDPLGAVWDIDDPNTPCDGATGLRRPNRVLPAPASDRVPLRWENSVCLPDRCRVYGDTQHGATFVYQFAPLPRANAGPATASTGSGSRANTKPLRLNERNSLPVGKPRDWGATSGEDCYDRGCTLCTIPRYSLVCYHPPHQTDAGLRLWITNDLTGNQLPRDQTPDFAAAAKRLNLSIAARVSAMLCMDQTDSTAPDAGTMLLVLATASTDGAVNPRLWVWSLKRVKAAATATSVDATRLEVRAAADTKQPVTAAVAAPASPTASGGDGGAIDSCDAADADVRYVWTLLHSEPMPTPVAAFVYLERYGLVGGAGCAANPDRCGFLLWKVSTAVTTAAAASTGASSAASPWQVYYDPAALYFYSPTTDISMASFDGRYFVALLDVSELGLFDASTVLAATATATAPVAAAAAVAIASSPSTDTTRLNSWRVAAGWRHFNLLPTPDSYPPRLRAIGDGRRFGVGWWNKIDVWDLCAQQLVCTVPYGTGMSGGAWLPIADRVLSKQR